MWHHCSVQAHLSLQALPLNSGNHEMLCAQLSILLRLGALFAFVPWTSAVYSMGLHLIFLSPSLKHQTQSVLI